MLTLKIELQSSLVICLANFISVVFYTCSFSIYLICIDYIKTRKCQDFITVYAIFTLQTHTFLKQKNTQNSDIQIHAHDTTDNTLKSE